MFGSLGTFGDIQYTRQEYNDSGAMTIHRKCFWVVLDAAPSKNQGGEEQEPEGKERQTVGDGTLNLHNKFFFNINNVQSIREQDEWYYRVHMYVVYE